MLGRAPLRAVLAMDLELTLRARAEAALRLRLGQLLEQLGRGACFELGFSSIAAYALERCQCGSRWAEAARLLARRLEVLPGVRRSLVEGRVGWSRAELLSRVAEPETEALWLVVGERLSVRQLRRLVRRGDEPHGDGESEGETCTLSCTVDREDAWLFEATRALLSALGAGTTQLRLEALLAEGQGSLLPLQKADMQLEAAGDVSAGESGAQRLWNDQRAQWREAAEARCEALIAGAGNAAEVGSGGLPQADAGASRGVSGGPSGGEVYASAAREASCGLVPLERRTPAELDAAAREIAEALSRHELELAELVLRFHGADGWRRLGYATETQYARERLGTSRSSLLARRALAVRLGHLPRLRGAMGAGQVGVEAARQIARVATLETEAAWIERARCRTLRHLREEVEAALVVVRVNGVPSCAPPLTPELDAFFDLERSALGGRVAPLGGGAAARGITSPGSGATPRESGNGVAESRPAQSRVEPEREPWRVMIRSLRSWLRGDGASEPGAASRSGLGGVQTSAGCQRARGRQLTSAGRVQLRFRVSVDVRRWFRDLEARARRWLPRKVSFLRFLCVVTWRAWRHLLGVPAAHGGIYLRDRYRCTSPACNRRDVTPHHLRFRSAGGGDESDNLVAVCSWCHLSGIHEGRIRASGRASNVRWELGRGAPCLVVEGRHKVATV